MGLFRFGFRLVFLYFFDFLFFLFFKNRITSESGDLRNFLHFLLLGFDKPGPECGDLIVVQIGAPGGGQFQGRRFVARRIISVRGKRAVISHAYVFVGGYRGGFGFSAGIGEKPTRKSSSEAARHDSASGSRLRWRRGSRGRPRIFGGLRGLAAGFLLDYRGCGSRYGFAAIFRERFTGKQDWFFSGIEIWRCGGCAALARCFRTAIIKAALPGAAWLESARLSATILALRTRFIASRVARALRPLRRGVFRRRQIAAARPAGASSAAASTAPSKTATATVAAGILPAIIATVVATAKILAWATGAT